MPASYVHQSVAKAAAGRLSLHFSDSDFAAYLSGCEGPDPLFFSFFNRGEQVYAPKAAAMMHTRQTEDFLCALLSQATSSLRWSYSCGFLTHYAADTVFHPFVYGHSLTEKKTYSPDMHGYIEHTYEIVRFRRDGHPQGIPQQLQGISLLTELDKQEIAYFFSDCMETAYPGKSLNTARIVKAFNASLRVSRRLRSENGRKYQFAGHLQFPARIDHLAHAHMIPPEPPSEDLWNDAHMPWSSIWTPDEIRAESMDDLYETSIVRSMELIEGAKAFLEGSITRNAFINLLGCLSYDSGLPWRESCSPFKAPACTGSRFADR